MESLAGQFLVSTPQMPDPRFQGQVVYLCAHNEEGAMGLVINNPNYKINLGDVLRGANIQVPEKLMPPIYIGGPVEIEAGFVLFSGDYRARYQLEVSESVFLSRDTKLLEDIARGLGPRHFLFMLGYAGWGPGQLDHELMESGWLTVPGDFDVLFNTPDELKWKTAASRIGIDITLFGDVIGNA